MLLRSLAAVLLLTLPAAAEAPPGLSVAEFDKLVKELGTAKEAWQSLPWKLSLLDASEQAAKEKKPLYLLVRSGHPLACV